MLINLNNYSWVNKYLITDINAKYSVTKSPWNICNIGKKEEEWTSLKNSAFFDIKCGDFAVSINKHILVSLVDGQQSKISFTASTITASDLDRMPASQDDWIKLFKTAAYKLEAVGYEMQMSLPNKLMGYVNKLLNDEDNTNELGLAYYIEEYDKQNKDEYVTSTRDEILTTLNKYHTINNL